jgi:hypothetical protein
VSPAPDGQCPPGASSRRARHACVTVLGRLYRPSRLRGMRTPARRRTLQLADEGGEGAGYSRGCTRSNTSSAHMKLGRKIRICDWMGDWMDFLLIQDYPIKSGH